MPVQVEQEPQDHSHVALTIRVPPEEYRKAKDAVYTSVARRTAVPGFRPGKAPRHLLARYIDEERIRELALERAVSEAYREAIRQTGVQPYRDVEPTIEMEEEPQRPEEEGLTLKVRLALAPHVHLGSLEGLVVRRPRVEVTEEDVERELGRLREELAEFQPTEEPSAPGDRVQARIRTTVDGEPVPELTFEEPRLFEIGQNIEEFDAALTGLRAGEERTRELTFPEDFEPERLRGRQGTIEVRVEEVLRRHVPTLEEVAARLQLEGPEELRAKVREQIKERARRAAEEEVNDRIVEELLRRAEVHYPQEVVEREAALRLSGLIRALEQRHLTLDQYLRSAEIDLVTLQNRLREEAQQAVEHTLVIAEFAAQNGIQVTDNDMEAIIRESAEKENMKPSQLRRRLIEMGRYEELRNRLLLSRVFDALRERVTIQDEE